MKFIYTALTAILFLGGCSSENSKSVPTDQAKIRNVILSYCEATTERRAEDIPELLFPDVFSDDMNKLSVVEMFYKQLDATKKFEITNVRFEEDAILLEDTGSVKVYCQKYFSETHIELTEGSPENVFKVLAEQATNSDPDAEIDYENLILKYTDKKKLVIVNQAGKYYLIPDAFFINLDTDLFDAKKALSDYLIA